MVCGAACGARLGRRGEATRGLATSSDERRKTPVPGNLQEIASRRTCSPALQHSKLAIKCSTWHPGRILGGYPRVPYTLLQTREGGYNQRRVRVYGLMLTVPPDSTVRTQTRSPHSSAPPRSRTPLYSSHQPANIGSALALQARGSFGH